MTGYPFTLACDFYLDLHASFYPMLTLEHL